MPVIILYLLKVSVSLAVVFFFYQFILRRLTFYNWNRYYLFLYSFLSFFIPFIDITPVLHEDRWMNSEMINWVPVISNAQPVITPGVQSAYVFTTWNWISLLIIAGMVVMMLRLFIQLLSFRQMRRKATLVHREGVKLYQVDKDIIPFSFGNSIFINRDQHSDKELKEIISHEFVHVRQHHSLDIIWGEILCLLNWYNPFAWLLRRSIRQNLEFIADDKVLAYGVDPKQYQFLLLKVIGNNHYSIAPKFNFSSLKKRIVMMNKMKSAGVHLVKFLFVLPLVAVLLIAFRNQDSPVSEERVLNPLKPVVDAQDKITDLRGVVFTDTLPQQSTPNSKGYYINVKGVNGHCVVVVSDKNGKEQERILLTEWNEAHEKYESKYGEVPPPPPPIPPHPPVAPGTPVPPMEATMVIPPVHPGTPVAPAAPVPPTRVSPCDRADATTPVVTANGNGIDLYASSMDYEITDTKAMIRLRTGEIEVYDLTQPGDKKKFEAKYGKFFPVTHTAVGYAPVAAATLASTGMGIPTPQPAGTYRAQLNDQGPIITGSEDIIITITRHTTREQLEEFKKQMKEKGVELIFDNINFNDGKLTGISGSMRSGSSRSNFTVTDLNKLFLALKRDGDKTWFKVSTREGRVVI